MFDLHPELRKRLTPKTAATLQKQAIRKTAGEVRFIKDRGGDSKEWGWAPPGPSERQINPDFKYNVKKIEPLALCLRATLMSLGHAISALNTLTRIKSSSISPDGNLGGTGYIQKIADMRKQLSSCIEALSANADTLYDEINAPHWNPDAEPSKRERQEVQEIMNEVEEIRADPEEWAEEVEETDKFSKKAQRRVLK